ncbi:ATP-binding protein [Runella sp. SP2]|uniref:ATP-binding protein n=1 Tax=Runella sp. SP2 TaxID=2268026 RepID=UPI000F090DA0|nr:ATP-binding protein [Runella sp. SP2]AYQ32568.1 ATP-binding protein [Runella sp. SP2]
MMETKSEKTGNWFVDQLSLYQNANNDSASVRRNFIVRTTEFDLIMSDLRRKKIKDPLQHELLLGRRGSGKSTLLRRIQIEIMEDPALNEHYIAINLAEEQAGIYRLSDLWYEVLQEIMLQTKQQLDLRAFSSFQSNQEYTRYLYDEIHKILRAHQKRAVLLLDNLDRIVENFDDDGHLMRETLLNYNDLQLVGGSTRMDEHFWKYDQPFYEFFRRHRLEGLTFEEIHQLLNQWSEALSLPQLKDYALKNRGKIEALRILTDGLPRTLQFFIKIFLQNSTLTGFDHIRQTMDLASPLYQERLNNLTAPQRKIVLEMAFIWEACSIKQLVDTCRMESKLISSYMKQLNSYGIVEIIPTSTKNHLYRLSERFFNMWLIVTQGNPDQKRKARYLTIFLETWYDAHEIQALARAHAQSLKEQNMGYDQAVVLTKAFSQSKYIGVEERDSLLDLTYQLSDYRPEKGDLPKKFEEILTRINMLRENGNFTKALEVIDEIENEEDGRKFAIKGYLHTELGNLEEAEKNYLLAVEKGNTTASFNLALLYQYQGKEKKAEALYLWGIKRGETNSLHNVALMYFMSNRKKQESLEYISECNKFNPDFKSKFLQIVIEVWNSIFDNLIARIKEIIKNNQEQYIEVYLYDLLYLEQTHLVLSLFEDAELGQSLRDKYQLLYYATLILNNKTEDNLLLRIPPDVMPTVEEIIERVKSKQVFYAEE